ncbi:receptor-like protein 2 [Pyrus communis]|uniref:receptor-like protein 2 n=1 Tax=Pyrus communis TaxID=23211 RepID=UPI0035C07A6C
MSRSLPEDIYNSLNGAISERIANLANLTILDLYFNYLSGVIPLNFGKLLKLKFMALDFNSLQGNLPLSLMNCTNLLEIHLGFNYLKGDLTTPNFPKLSHLSKLDLMKNNFTGILPTSLYSCWSLKEIRLSRNPYLEGQIQPKICSLKSLSFLSLGFIQLTNFTGAMKMLMGCKSLHTLLLTGSFYHKTELTDDDMVDFHGFQNLRVLSLQSCGLTGQLPGWLSNLKNLELIRELHFDGNNFSNLRYLELLNLSMNHLSRKLPLSITSLHFLKEFDVSYNNLKGKIPTSTQLHSFNASVFEGNLQLCGAPLPNECKDIDADNERDELPWFYIFAALGFIVGFWGVCGSLVLNKTWRYAYF